MIINRSKRESIEKLAEIVRDALEVDIPIEIEKVPKKLGGKLRYVERVEDHNVEAMIKKVDDTFEIQIRQDVYHLRNRFSIAHELGHLFMHMGYIIDEELWKDTDDYKDSVYYRYGHTVEEHEANEFAAAFLMPKDIFIEIAEKHYEGGTYNLQPIADFFKVSIEAARVRGRRLGLFSQE